MPARVDYPVATRSHSASTLRIKNLAASTAIVAAACSAYVLAPYNAELVNRTHVIGLFLFTGGQFMVAASVAYALLLVPYFLVIGEPTVSKSLRFFQLLASVLRTGSARPFTYMPAGDRVAVLSTLLKAFYAPLMSMALMLFCVGAIAHGSAIVETESFSDGFRAVFDRHGFWLVMQVILFFDVLIYTVGYLVEMPRLRNEIRSVDPTLLGWAAALACYTPFNYFTIKILGFQATDFPQFENPTAHLVLNFAVLVLFAIFTSASIAMGFKASNLTHRGIVTRGPYAFVRHPAYASKNLGWWIGAIPSVSAAFSVSFLDGVQAIASVVGFTLLYVLRAITEEEHLRSVDGEYAAYATKVRYRFIPGLY